MEICPVFVVEICPDLAIAVRDKAVTNNTAPVTDLRFFIWFAPGKLKSG